MRILIIGTGHIGAWMVEELCHDHEVAIFDNDLKKMKYFFNVARFLAPEEAAKFDPEMLINAVSLHNTIEAYNTFLPYVSKKCMLADTASVKTGLQEFYSTLENPYVSTHPMFGPTFANIRNLSNENAIIISESSEEGKKFFEKIYGELKLNIFYNSFEEHDRTIAYSLSIPFASSMVFAACMEKQDAPGTTFRKITGTDT